MKNVLLRLKTILLIVVQLSVILSLVEAIQSETTKGKADEGTLNTGDGSLCCEE
jgi:hypothetical protein